MGMKKNQSSIVSKFSRRTIKAIKIVQTSRNWALLPDWRLSFKMFEGSTLVKWNHKLTSLITSALSHQFLSFAQWTAQNCWDQNCWDQKSVFMTFTCLDRFLRLSTQWIWRNWFYFHSSFLNLCISFLSFCFFFFISFISILFSFSSLPFLDFFSSFVFSFVF